MHKVNTFQMRILYRNYAILMKFLPNTRIVSKENNKRKNPTNCGVLLFNLYSFDTNQRRMVIKCSQQYLLSNYKNRE